MIVCGRLFFFINWIKPPGIAYCAPNGLECLE